MKFYRRTLMEIADLICGNFPAEVTYFAYRSSWRQMADPEGNEFCLIFTTA